MAPLSLEEKGGPAKKFLQIAQFEQTGGGAMTHFEEITKTISTMPAAAMLTIVLLAACALAGYAIYAILTVTKGKP